MGHEASDTAIDPQLIMDELAADRNKNADDKAVARALVRKLRTRCAELETENARLKEQLDAGKEGSTQ